MIRFIVRRRWRDAQSGASGERFYTIDGDVAQLERDLRSGGHGNDCYEVRDLMAVELVDDRAERKAAGEAGG